MLLGTRSQHSDGRTLVQGDVVPAGAYSLDVRRLECLSIAVTLLPMTALCLSLQADTTSKFSTVVSAAQRQARRQDRTARWTFCRGQVPKVLQLVSELSIVCW